MKAVPDAHLNVIGSGKVYNSNAVLGPYGIAEESYENEFMPYLIDDNGGILPSVTFWGSLGKEKNEILARTKVGVPNPAGTSETFCLSAVEMALYGARIVSKKYVGLIDTVPNDIGTLFKSENELCKLLIGELQGQTSRKSWEFINSNFSSSVISQEWLVLIHSLLKGEPVYSTEKPVNSSYNLKFLRELNRKLKRFLPFGKKLPTIDFYISVICRIFKLKYKDPIIKF